MEEKKLGVFFSVKESEKVIAKNFLPSSLHVCTIGVPAILRCCQVADLLAAIAALLPWAAIFACEPRRGPYSPADHSRKKGVKGNALRIV